MSGRVTWSSLPLIQVLRTSAGSGCLNAGYFLLISYLEVHDVSMQGRAEYPSDQVNSELGGLRHLSSTGVKARLPWSVEDLAGIHNSHGSIVFSCVNVKTPRFLWECDLSYSSTLRASAPVIVPWTSGTFVYSIKCVSTVMLEPPWLQFTSSIPIVWKHAFLLT